MNRAVRLASLAAALSLGGASVAQAETLVNNTYCGGNTFSTCAFINSSTSTVGGVTVLTLTVTNPSTNPSGSVFTAIGIANLPAGADVTSATVVSSTGTVSFVYNGSGPSGLNGAGIGADVVGFEAVPPPTVNGLNPGESVTFTFTFDGVYNLNSLQYALHDQGGSPAGCEPSTKLVLNGSVGQYSANSATCGPPVTTVPEPASMTLLATGLAGMAAARRRRNKKTV